MQIKHLARLFVTAAFAVVMTGTCTMAQSDFNYDQQSWSNLSTAEQEEVLANIKFEMLHERNDSLQQTLDELKSFRAVRTELSTNNMLKIPMRTGKLEVSALFKKARGEILVCTPTKIEAVLDTYRLVATADPQNPGKVLASFAGNDPNIPAEPVTGTIKSDGTTARITAGADWIELTWSGKNSYTCRTNKVPVKITARFID